MAAKFAAIATLTGASCARHLNKSKEVRRLHGNGYVSPEWTLPNAERNHANQQRVDAHPKKELLAFVRCEMPNWSQRIVPEESDRSDRYAMLETLNPVNRIAFVPVPARTAPARALQRRKSTNARTLRGAPPRKGSTSSPLNAGRDR